MDHTAHDEPAKLNHATNASFSTAAHDPKQSDFGTRHHAHPLDILRMRHKSTLFTPTATKKKHRLSYSTNQVHNESSSHDVSAHYSPFKVDSLEVQQMHGSSDAKPSIILYRLFTKPNNDEFKFDYYPPPHHLRPPLADNIKKVLEKNGNYEINNELIDKERQARKLKQKRFKEKDIFINPKSLDVFTKKKYSRMQTQFINQYKELFMHEGKQVA